MLDVLFRVVMPYTTNLPRDVAINDWAAQVPTADDIFGCATLISEFYTEAGDEDWSVGSRLSSLITRSADGCRVDVYVIDTATGQIGFPQGNVPFTMPTPTTSSVLPPEVAVCLSMSAPVIAPAKPARRRGRIFLGPLTSVVVSDLGLHVGTEFADVVCRRMESTVTQFRGFDAAVCVWSRTDAGLFPVDNGWVDNAWDTQRRRGVEATSRTVWQSLPLP